MRSSYYALMQAAKDVSVEFPEALDRLHHKTGRMEASFAKQAGGNTRSFEARDRLGSPQALRITVTAFHATNRQAKIVHVYGEPEAHAELAISPLGPCIPELFDEKYPKASLTHLKKMISYLANQAGLKLFHWSPAPATAALDRGSHNIHNTRKLHGA